MGTFLTPEELAKELKKSYETGWKDGERATTRYFKYAVGHGLDMTQQIRMSAGRFNNMTTIEIALALNMTSDGATCRGLSKELKRQGWKRKQQRRGKRVSWVWIAPVAEIPGPTIGSK